MTWSYTLAGYTFTESDFSGNNYVTGFPLALQKIVEHGGNIYADTSSSSNAIGLGSKSFTVTSGKPYQPGTPLRIADAAAPSTNYLDAIVTSYSGTSLVVDVVAAVGSGTLTSWNLNIGGGSVTVGSPVSVLQGGTGATTASGARANLGAVNIAGDTMSGALTAPSFIVSGASVPANGIYLPAASTLGFAVNSIAEMQLTTTALSPAANDGLALGTTALMWSDIFLATGAVINFNNGNVTLTHAAATLTLAGATSGFIVNNAATTASSFSVTSNSLTTGNAASITSTSTAGGASGVSRTLNVTRSGANANLAHTAYGVYCTVTNTNATSGTNIAGYFSASGATTANYGLIVENGFVGIGTPTPSYQLHQLSATRSRYVLQGGTANTGTQGADITFYDGTTSHALGFAQSLLGSGGSDLLMALNTGSQFRVWINSLGEVMKIDATGAMTISGNSTIKGRVGLNAAVRTDAGVAIGTDYVALAGANQFGIIHIPTFTSAATGFVRAFQMQVTIPNVTFTCGQAVSLYVANPNKGASATLTDNYGLYVENLTAGTNNYPIYVAGSNGTNFFGGCKQNFHASGGVDVTSGTSDGVTMYSAGYTHMSYTSEPLSLRRRSTDGGILTFYKNTAQVGFISVTASATAYNTSSDRDLKTGWRPLVKPALETVCAVPVYSLIFKNDPDQRRVVGWLADELQQHIPEAVTGEYGAVDENGNRVYQMVDYSKTMPLVFGCIHELKAITDGLKAANDGLASRLDTLEQRLAV